MGEYKNENKAKFWVFMVKQWENFFRLKFLYPLQSYPFYTTEMFEICFRNT